MGAADFVVPLDRIAEELIHRVQQTPAAA